MSEDKHEAAILALASELGPNVRKHIESVLGIAAPVEVVEPPPAPVAETVVSQHPLDAEVEKSE